MDVRMPDGVRPTGSVDAHALPCPTATCCCFCFNRRAVLVSTILLSVWVIAMLLLNSTDVRQALPMPVAIEAMKRAFIALESGAVQMPERTHLDIAQHEGVTLIMPSHIAGDDQSLAVKVVSVFAGNPARGKARIQAVVNVFDPETGEPIALLEGAALTAIRTAAVSGAATDFLAPTHAEVLGILGSGVQARSHIRAVCAVRPIQRIQIYAPTRSRLEQLAAEISDDASLPNDIVIAESADATVRDAQIVCTVTTARDPVFSDQALAPGTHINAVGSYQPHVREIPEATVLRALVYVDQRHAAWAEAGDLIQPRDAGLIDADHIVAELGQLASGTPTKQLKGNQVSLFKSVGLAMQDAFAASVCLAGARSMQLGQTAQW